MRRRVKRAFVQYFVQVQYSTVHVFRSERTTTVRIAQNENCASSIQIGFYSFISAACSTIAVRVTISLWITVGLRRIVVIIDERPDILQNLISSKAFF